MSEIISLLYFSLEQPRDTPIVFTYEILDAGHVIDFQLCYGQSQITDSNIIMHRTFDTATGHVDFVTDASGYFTYCLRQVKSDDKSTRFKMIVNYGFDDEYYEKLSEEEKIDAVNTLETHKINDLLLMTINEADYQKHKEVKYHSQTERMNRTVLWWPMLQIGILVITGILQVQSLKSFFKQNKLI